MRTLPALQSVYERLLVNDRPSGRVHNDDAVPHLCEGYMGLALAADEWVHAHHFGEENGHGTHPPYPADAVSPSSEGS